MFLPLNSPQEGHMLSISLYHSPRFNCSFASAWRKNKAIDGEFNPIHHCTKTCRGNQFIISSDTWSSAHIVYIHLGKCKHVNLIHLVKQVMQSVSRDKWLPSEILVGSTSWIFKAWHAVRHMMLFARLYCDGLGWRYKSLQVDFLSWSELIRFGEMADG